MLNSGRLWRSRCCCIQDVYDVTIQNVVVVAYPSSSYGGGATAGAQSGSPGTLDVYDGTDGVLLQSRLL